MSKEILEQVKIQNLKSFQTHDGYAYSGTFCIGKTKIATVRNDGSGGNTDYDFVNAKAEAMFNKFVKDNDLRQVIADTWNEDDDVIKYKRWTAEDMNDENIISHFMEEFTQIKADKKVINRMQKKGICFGVPGSGIFDGLSWKVTLEQLINAGHKDKLEAEIKKLKGSFKNGEVIHNTNLTKLGIEV